MTPHTAEGSITIPSRLGAISRVEQEVLAALERCGFGEADHFAVKLALDEAMANAVKHGNANDPTKQVVVRYQIDDHQAHLSIEDEGVGFSPHTVPDPTRDENLPKPHGRGVMLMRAYMHHLEFNEAGNIVTMIRKKSESATTN